ncbi:uncharacterized protein LOC27207570 [Drosophila simulans]|uniref:Seminal fluid protein n=1 Tax=Drosophila simulans TaxID=7240 RepID=A0A0J9S0E9_DROSI|nr:uncharacterized protein LOC27207570 [Drosophila simulans]KMZ00895.1 uncharacterized protein Dsimw501_GD27721 [Drosophila simulans]
MMTKVVLICLLATLSIGFVQGHLYKPLLCEETNANITRSSLLAQCVNQDECFINRPVGLCPKFEVCCVKKQDFNIDEVEYMEY